MIALLLGVAPSAAQARPQPVSLQVEFGANGSDLWSPTLRSPDVVAKRYSVAASPGATPRTTTITGYSLDSLLTAWEQHEGVSPGQFSLVEIPGETGTVLMPEAEAMTNPSTMTRAPVFWTDRDGNVGFADDKAEDSLSQVDQIRLYTGQELTVTITATKDEIPDNTSASFTASVSPAAGSLRYDWIVVGNTEDDRPTASPTYKAPFSAEGSYRAYVVVTDATSGSIGVSKQIAIDVGPPSRRPSAKHDGRVGKRKRKRASGSGGATHGSTGTGNQSGKPATVKDGQAGAAKVKAKRSASSQPTRTPSSKSAATTKHTPTSAKRYPSGPLLSGILVANPQDASVRRSPPRSASSVDNPAQTGHLIKTATGHGLHLSESAWIAVGALSALGVGMLLESGELRRRLLLRSPREAV